MTPHIGSRIRTGAADKIAACFSYHPGGSPVPMWVSGVAFVVAGGVTLMLWREESQ